MPKLQFISNVIKKPTFILTLILAVFFLKGLFVAAIYPVFTGQDEARHYNTIQFLAEPKEKNWPIRRNVKPQDGGGIASYNNSQEIHNIVNLPDLNNFRSDTFKKSIFNDIYDGENEDKIDSMIWKPYNFNYPPDVAGGKKSLYHNLAAILERALSGQNMLVRFFSNRILSVLLGTFTIFLYYLTVKSIGMSEKNSLIITAIISFQTKVTTYFTNINYDVLLIPLFALFTLSAILSLKNGLTWKNGSLMIISVIAALFTKGTGIVLLGVFVFLLSFHFYTYYKATTDKKKIIKYLIIVLILFLVSVFTFFKLHNLDTISPDFGKNNHSLEKYLSTSLSFGRSGLGSKSYWGVIGWKDSWLLSNFQLLMIAIETLPVIGLVIYLFSKKNPPFLPEKKYVIFLTAMIVALELGIRFADWKVFSGSGRLDLGTPGRYFLPNVAAHIILVFVGLGTILRREKYFVISLAAGFILMFSLTMYTVFNIIIPRYYL